MASAPSQLFLSLGGACFLRSFLQDWVPLSWVRNFLQIKQEIWWD